MTTLETDTLAELIRTKHACLLRLSDMGHRQGELIDAGNMTALLDMLAHRQRLLVQLQQIERALGPFRNQDADNRHWRSEEDRRACAEQLRQCEALLGEIIDREKRNETTLKRRRDEVALQLKGAHAAEVARGAYTATPQHGVNQLDLLSDT